MHLTAEALTSLNSYRSRPLLKLYKSRLPSLPPMTTCHDS